MESDEDPEAAGGADERPFDESLCWRCRNHREIEAARSVFVTCKALGVKYPRQPVETLPELPTELTFRSVVAHLSPRRTGFT
jgi:hypothetical protein